MVSVKIGNFVYMACYRIWCIHTGHNGDKRRKLHGLQAPRFEPNKSLDPSAYPHVGSKLCCDSSHLPWTERGSPHPPGHYRARRRTVGSTWRERETAGNHFPLQPHTLPLSLSPREPPLRLIERTRVSWALASRMCGGRSGNVSRTDEFVSVTTPDVAGSRG